MPSMWLEGERGGILEKWNTSHPRPSWNRPELALCDQAIRLHPGAFHRPQWIAPRGFLGPRPFELRPPALGLRRRRHALRPPRAARRRVRPVASRGRVAFRRAVRPRPRSPSMTSPPTWRAWPKSAASKPATYDKFRTLRRKPPLRRRLRRSRLGRPAGPHRAGTAHVLRRAPGNRHVRPGWRRSRGVFDEILGLRGKGVCARSWPAPRVTDWIPTSTRRSPRCDFPAIARSCAPDLSWIIPSYSPRSLSRPS